MNSSFPDSENANSESSEADATPVQSELIEEKSADPYVFFRGTIEKISFRSEESGFTVMKCKPEADLVGMLGDSTNVVGLTSETVTRGCNIVARGSWNVHPKFGKQFKAKSISETRPTGSDAICRYLASGAIKGFGPVLAERLVEAFGDETLKILDEDPDRLLEVPGIGDKKLGEIKESWNEKSNLREVVMFFQNHDISISLAQKIYKEYKDRSIELVKANPYMLTSEVWGIGFKTADQIALSLGLDRESNERISAGIEYTVKSASDEGHCFLPNPKVIEKSAQLLEIQNRDLLADSLVNLIYGGKLIQEGEDIYTPRLYKDECAVSEIISQRVKASEEPNKKVPKVVLEKYSSRLMEISVAGQGSKMLELSDEQKQALSFVANNTITVITGGPGCGKTTVVKAVSKMLREAGLKVGLAAPTGRAAQRLGEVCGLESSTIHRLLKFDPMKGSFVHNKKDLLDYEALILDECSMIDISLAARTLEALDGRARLVLVGDADQLPSVGPGRFLGDLLEVPEIPRVRLNQLFRRTEESSINHIAHSINSSEVPRIPEPDGKTKSDSYFLRAPTPEDAVSLIERLVSDQIPRKFADSFNIGPKDIMVLSPMNKGNLGVITLNQRLQEKFIPEERRNSKVRCGALTFYLGDRVIQRVNNYNIDPAGVFNGDQGEIIAIDAEAQIVTVRLWDGREVEYSSKELLELDLAYALTIHRSQGSEVPVVVLALHDTHNFMLERQLLYTAVTRAKKLLIVVGSKRALNIAIKRVRSTRRHTNLVKRTGSDSGQLSLT